jgi:hypothetical protein
MKTSPTPAFLSDSAPACASGSRLDGEHPTDCTQHALPDVLIDSAHPGESLLTRVGVIKAKHDYSVRRADTANEMRGMKQSPKREELYREIRDCVEKEALLEGRLKTKFIPQHGLTQFLSPRAFFQSSLFNAQSRSVTRRPNIELELLSIDGRPALNYSGPELRQSDGRVFLALLHMLRDVQVGTRVLLQPEQMCVALFGRYDGNSRKQLLSHIQRLQKGLMLTDTFSVQLCQEFDYPKRGPWRVALHPHIVQLFLVSPKVWLSMPMRLSLPEGLPTWLYAYIESQTYLIPMRVSTIQTLSGSVAGERAFNNSLRLALRVLSSNGILESGWSLRHGKVHWLKKLPPKRQA